MPTIFKGKFDYDGEFASDLLCPSGFIIALDDDLDRPVSLPALAELLGQKRNCFNVATSMFFDYMSMPTWSLTLLF